MSGYAHVRDGSMDLYGVIGVKAFRYRSSPCSAGAATSPRPDLFFARLLGAAAVKGGRRPSRSDLPLTAASTAADLRDRGASFPVQCQQLRRYRGGARHRARRLRATNLYSADP